MRGDGMDADVVMEGRGTAGMIDERYTSISVDDTRTRYASSAQRSGWRGFRAKARTLLAPLRALGYGD